MYKKHISLALKISSLVFLVMGAILPSLSGSVSTQWITNQPPNSPNNFNGIILEFGVFTFKANELKYNNDTNDFYLTPISTDNDSDPFIHGMRGFQKLLQLLFLISFAFIGYATIIQWRHRSKLATLLLIIGITCIVLMIFLIALFQANALKALATNGGTIVGDTVVIDKNVEVNNVNYVWRNTISVSLKGGFTFLVLSSITAFLSLFFKAQYVLKWMMLTSTMNNCKINKIIIPIINLFA